MTKAPIPRDLLEVHRRYNRNSATLWAEFADHRTHVTELALAAGGDRLAVLGAGNCNDLDLPALAARFTEIHLCDLDQDAVQRARERQPPETAARLVVHAPVDLCGVLPELKAFAGKPPARAQIAAMRLASTEAVVSAVPGPFDTVLSACLLSQIMHTCRVALGAGHPQLEIIADALAVAHLRAMVGLLRPGGTGLLVTDTSSSDIYPLAERWNAQPPLDLLEKLQDERKLLGGTDPSLLLRTLDRDEVVAPAVGPPSVIEPWLWKMGPLTMLVYAIGFKRRGG
jgi:hypothetical protein